MSQTFLGQFQAQSSFAYQRTVNPAPLGAFLNLEQAELLRLRRYQESWRFYIGQHWTFAREDGEPLVTVNYARRIVDKLSDWLKSYGPAELFDAAGVPLAAIRAVAPAGERRMSANPRANGGEQLCADHEARGRRARGLPGRPG